MHTPLTVARLRTLAAAASSGRTVCLQGGTACGKTALVQELARLAGRRLHVLPLTADSGGRGVDTCVGQAHSIASALTRVQGALSLSRPHFIGVAADVADIIGSWVPDTAKPDGSCSSSRARATLLRVLASLARTALFEVVPAAAQQLSGEPLSRLLQPASQLLASPVVTAWAGTQEAVAVEEKQLMQVALCSVELVQAARRACAAGALRLPSVTVRALQRCEEQLVPTIAAAQWKQEAAHDSSSPDPGASQLSFRWVDAPLVAALKSGDWVST